MNKLTALTALCLIFLLNGCVSMPKQLTDIVPETAPEPVAPVMSSANAGPAMMSLFVYTAPSNKAVGKRSAFKDGYAIKFALFGQADKKSTAFTSYFDDKK